MVIYMPAKFLIGGGERIDKVVGDNSGVRIIKGVINGVITY